MLDQRYFTRAQAAELLGADEDKVTQWIHSGELVAINVATSPTSKRPRWRIAESDLGRFVMSRRHPASVQATAKPKQSRTAKAVTAFYQ